MIDGEWRLAYPAANGFPSGDLTWGISIPTWNITAPVIGDPDSEVADAGRARSDGVDFGVDFLKGRTISFDIGVTGASPTVVRANHSGLARLWRADAVRSVPGAVAELHTQYRGIERIAYGRPRRYTPNLSEVTTTRFAQVTADFATTDSVWYSAATYSASVALAPALGGGFTAPFTAPITTTQDSDRSAGFTIDTDLPAWPVITITGGQITDPVVEVVGLWSLQLRGTFAYDEIITIDTRPWMRAVTRSSGASLAGSLTRTSSRLSQSSIPAGAWELGLRGKSDSNTATATLVWRTAHPTP